MTTLKGFLPFLLIFIVSASAAVEVLGNLLKRIKDYNSPSSVPHEENVASAGISSRQLFNEDEVCLGND